MRLMFACAMVCSPLRGCIKRLGPLSAPVWRRQVATSEDAGRSSDSFLTLALDATLNIWRPFKQGRPDGQNC